MRSTAVVPVVVLLVVLCGCESDPVPSGESGDTLADGPQPAARSIGRSYEQRVGTVFTPGFPRTVTSVLAEEVALPAAPGMDAIWGALGRGDDGHVWIGLSASGQQNARLYNYTPETGTFVDLGDTVSALERAAIYRDGEMQHKIHSHIQQADDGFVYFSSMDESGESWQRGQLPRWGSHLWRIRPGTSTWEHVLSAPEGLLALNAVGRYVYALGYWDHVLYQFDTRTQVVRSVTVGSACGHVSRNFVADLRGHVYVPRVVSSGKRSEACAPETMTASLVELNPDLDVVARHAIEGYLGRSSPASNHGITGYAFRADGSVLFVTHTAEVFHLIMKGREPALLMQLGRIHPGKIKRVASLFSVDGGSLLATLGRVDKRAHWIRHDTATMEVSSIELDLPPHRGLLLYGSMVRDNAGNYYLGGRLQAEGGPMRPVLIRVRESGE